MTVASVMDTISRLPGMSGEANDAVSAYTQVKMSDALRMLLLLLLETECPKVWIKLPRNRRPKQRDNVDHTIRTTSMWTPIGRTAMGKKIGICLVARRLDESNQLIDKLNLSYQDASTTKHEWTKTQLHSKVVEAQEKD